MKQTSQCFYDKIFYFIYCFLNDLAVLKKINRNEIKKCKNNYKLFTKHINEMIKTCMIPER